VCFRRGEENVRCAIRDGGEGGIESGRGIVVTESPEKLDGGGFAEGACSPWNVRGRDLSVGIKWRLRTEKPRRLKPTLHGATRADFSSVAEFCLPELQQFGLRF